MVYHLAAKCPIGHWGAVGKAQLQAEADKISDDELAAYEQRLGHESVVTRELARRYGFEDRVCDGCENYTLVRAGTCFLCLTCGATTGCS